MTLYTISEAASKLGLSEQILSRMESEGKLHSIIVKSSGKEIKSFNLEELSCFYENNNFDAQDIFEIVTYKYEFFKNRNYQIKDGANIIGHIITKFCDMQRKNNTLFDVNYDVVWFENKPIHTCDILRNGKIREAILVTGEENKEKSFTILKKYMDNNFINKGIIIVGTTWNMIDGNEKISIDFKNNVDVDVFKSFMI